MLDLFLLHKVTCSDRLLRYMMYIHVRIYNPISQPADFLSVFVLIITGETQTTASSSASTHCPLHCIQMVEAVPLLFRLSNHICCVSGLIDCFCPHCTQTRPWWPPLWAIHVHNCIISFLVMLLYMYELSLSLYWNNFSWQAHATSQDIMSHWHFEV